MKIKSKKSKSKKKTKSEAKPENQLSEVDKTFYELQISDLNRKLARLTNLSSELEHRNETLTLNNRNLDEDRADVIAYLKKTVQDQSDEIVDLLGRLQALKATLQAENLSFQEQLAKKDVAFQEMQSQLQSEIKLFEGKLNALEEFRVQRDELNKMFEVQERCIEEQAQSHNNELYAIEKKFIEDKDKLIKQLEFKLRKLAEEFQNVTDMRITESTQRMIRENIAVNNENVQLVKEQKDLYKDRKVLLEKCKMVKVRKEVAESQCKEALKKCSVLKGVIAELTTKCEKFQEEIKELKVYESKIEDKSIQIKELNHKIVDLRENIQLLQSNLRDSMRHRKLLISELTKSNRKAEFMTTTLFEAIFKIRQRIGQNRNLNAIKTERNESREEEESKELPLEHSQAILSDLYEMFLNAKEAERECKDLDKWVQFYRTGCAGFVPKPREIQQITEVNRSTQVGDSFEEFLALDTHKPKKKWSNNRKKLQKWIEGNSSNSQETTIPSDFSSQ